MRRRPHPALAQSVDYYWCLSDAPAHKAEHIVPTGTLEMVFNLDQDEIPVAACPQGGQFARYSGAVVSGAYRSFFVIDPLVHASMLGVHFKPGGAFPILGIPPGELEDRHANLEALWGRSAGLLRERLCAAKGPGERFDILDRELAARLVPQHVLGDEMRYALRELMKTDAGVARVAGDLGVSHRRLIELFVADVGLAPKTFHRISRFQRTLAMARRRETPDWAQLAAACGYFDQSHLIRECVALSGLPPLNLMRGLTGVKEHHAVGRELG